MLIGGRQVVPRTDPCYKCAPFGSSDYSKYCEQGQQDASVAYYIDTSAEWIAGVSSKAAVRIEVQQAPNANRTAKPLLLDQVYLRTYAYIGQ